MRVGLTTSIATAIAVGVLIASGGGSGACAYPTCFPSASNTGVPAGTVLTDYTGPRTITAATTVIDSKRLNATDGLGCLEIENTATSVTITNSEFHCPQGAYNWGIRTRLGYTGTVTITDSTITCDNTDATAVGSFGFTLLRVNIYGCANGLSFAEDLNLQDSYLHDWNCCTDDHPDGIQTDSDGWGQSDTHNWLVRHNTIFGQNYQGEWGNSSIIANNLPTVNVLIEQNLFGGGTYTISCPNSAGEEIVRNNHFTNRWYSTIGLFGPVSGCQGEDGGGNVVDETGAPIDMSFGG